MSITVRAYEATDVPAMVAIWNEVVATGQAFPQEHPETIESATAFFAAQSHCAVAVSADGVVVGMYILHPNNIGRCGHIGNASYAVASTWRGRGVGEALVRDSLQQAPRLGFDILQFNAVAADNTPANHLYTRLGFQLLGQIPGGFRRRDGEKVPINLYYYLL